MDSKFLGVGLTNAIGIALFTMLTSVCLKVVFSKHEIEGVSEVVRAAFLHLKQPVQQVSFFRFFLRLLLWFV